MPSKIEILEKEIEELREQLAVGKTKPRTPRLDTLAEAVDRARRGNVPGTMCIARDKKLVAGGFKVCAANTTSRETQTEI